MKMQLRKPCKNCPFGVAETRIKFRCRERAEEIAEQAYRDGFPCHLSAELEDDDDFGEGGGYVPGPNTQHCAGALGMFANEYQFGGSVWPAIGNSERVAEQIIKRMGPEGLAMCFESEAAFIEANGEAQDE
jgi:hypothetical protein